MKKGETTVGSLMPVILQPDGREESVIQDDCGNVGDAVHVTVQF